MIHAYPRYLAFVGIVLACSSCSVLGVGTNRKVAFDTISSQEETLIQIQNSPTHFSLSIEENEAAWERARFFLEQYAGKGKISSEHSSDRDVMTKIGSSGFRYQMVRQFEKGKVGYQVFCTPKDSKRSNAEALLNAKNVARFVREGELEISQLAGS